MVATVIDLKKVVCSLRIGGEILSRVEDFKDYVVLFINGVAVEIELDRWISAVMQSLFHSVAVKEGTGPKGKAFDLLVHLHSNRHL